MKYSIDTSAIVDVWRGPYSPDVFPDIPDLLSELLNRGDLCAADEVLVELEKKDADATGWAKRNRTLFVKLEEYQSEVVEVLNQFPYLAKERPNRGRADGFVIALAKRHGCAVVTSERAGNSSVKPKIPDVCRELGIRSLPLVDLFRDQGWVFRK